MKKSKIKYSPTTLDEAKKKINTDLYDRTEKEKEVVSTSFSKFREYADNRNRTFQNFDGINLTKYIEDSYRRYTTNIDIREDTEDWQSIVHDQITRNKVNAVLAKIVAVLPIAEIQPRGDEDIIKAQIVNEIYQYSEDVDDYEEFMVRFLLEAIVKGTAIGYEGHLIKNQVVRDIVSGDGDEIKIKESIKSQNKLFAEVVPLEEFYPSNVAVPRIKDMSSCFRRKVIPHGQFIFDFSSMFEKAVFVEPKRTTDNADEEKPYYYDYISQDVEDGNVEILFYYDIDSDQYIVIANGVWLNPIIIDGKEEISPLPFNHKELPFFDLRFELFSADFFYGKSLPDKLKTMQDVLNVVTNMLLDQSFLSIFTPILTNGFDSVEDDYLRPGRRIPIDTQGLPIQQTVMPLQMNTPGGWHQFILDYTRKVMEEASVDKVSQGIAGAGDRVTAKEISIAAEGVSSLLGLFGRWIKYSLKRKCLLRTKNALQFWTDKDMPITEGILGNGGSGAFKNAFNVIKIDNTTLSNGKRGTKIIGLFADQSKVPTAKELSDKAKAQKVVSKRDIEYVALVPSYIRDIDFDIKAVINRKSENTRDMEKAMMMEKVRVYKSFFPNLVNDEELFAQMAEKMGDDPTKIMKEDVLNNILQKGEQQNKMADGGVSTEPQGDIMQNAMKSAMGKEIGVQNIRELQGQMLG